MLQLGGPGQFGSSSAGGVWGTTDFGVMGSPGHRGKGNIANPARGHARDLRGTERSLPNLRSDKKSRSYGNLISVCSRLDMRLILINPSTRHVRKRMSWRK